MCRVSDIYTPKCDLFVDKNKVAEIKHGEWTEFEDEQMGTVYQCTICKEEFVTIDGTPAQNLWNYCPNCGAEMDGKGNDNG